MRKLIEEVVDSVWFGFSK